MIHQRENKQALMSGKCIHNNDQVRWVVYQQYKLLIGQLSTSRDVHPHVHHVVTTCAYGYHVIFLWMVWGLFLVKDLRTPHPLQKEPTITFIEHTFQNIGPFLENDRHSLPPPKSDQIIICPKRCGIF